MIVKINMDKTLSGEERQHDYFRSKVEDELKRFESHITRIEVHLKDENGIKEGFNDLSCMLEARLEGRQPIAVSSQGGTVEQALSNAIDKIKTSVETIIGKSKNY